MLPAARPFNLYNTKTTPLRFVDLSGAAPVEVTVNPPAEPAAMFGSRDARIWAYRDANYLVHDLPNNGNPPRQFGLGHVVGVAGANNRAAVATADGKVRVFDLNNRALLMTLDAANPKLGMTTDGGTLVVLPRDGVDRTLRFYSLPTGNEVREWPFIANNGQPMAADFVLAQSADKITLDLASQGTGERTHEVRRFDGTLEYSLTTLNLLNLSPDGAQSFTATNDGNTSAATLIYTGTTIAAAANGYAVGWLGENRILVNFFKQVCACSAPWEFDGAKIIDATGHVVAHSGLPRLEEFQVVSASTVYSRPKNTIFDINSGVALWTGYAGSFNAVPTSSWKQGAVAGDHVVFEAIDLPAVRVQPR